MRHEPKLFPYMISNSESQTPLFRFFLRGGGGCTQAKYPVVGNVTKSWLLIKNYPEIIKYKLHIKIKTKKSPKI